MRKCLVFIGIILGFSLISEAQMPSNTRESKAVAIGLKGGVNLPRMYYLEDAPLDLTDQALVFTPMGGVFVEIPMGDILMIAPEFVYLQRGTDMSYVHHSGSQVHYSMSVHFVDFRLPFELRLPIKKYFQPYFAFGPEVGLRIGGEIHMDRTEPAALDQTIPVGNANMSLIHGGAFAGLGIRSRVSMAGHDVVFKLSASVHQGLLDTYSAGEQDGTVPAVNVNAYQPKGVRLPQGLEVTFGIAFPLEKAIDDACSTFSNDRYRRHGSGRHLFGY